MSKSKTDIWMPLYIGDYLADTIGLTHADHGAYLLSIMAYWRKGAALSTQEAQQIMGGSFDRVSLFYKSLNGTLSHSRVDDELSQARKRKQTATENGKKGGRPVTPKKPTDNLQVSYGLAKRNPNKSSSPSPSPSPTSLSLSSKKDKKTLTPLPENFTISETVKKWASSKSIYHLEKHLDHFKDTALAKGYKYVDWDAAFRNAIKNDWAKVKDKKRDYEYEELK